MIQNFLNQLLSLVDELKVVTEVTEFLSKGAYIKVEMGKGDLQQ
jgi:hypothetical protein